jgi:hypothetical protein
MSIKAVYNEKMKNNKNKFTSMSIKTVYNEKMKNQKYNTVRRKV